MNQVFRISATLTAFSAGSAAALRESTGRQSPQTAWNWNSAPARLLLPLLSCEEILQALFSVLQYFSRNQLFQFPDKQPADKKIQTDNHSIDSHVQLPAKCQVHRT